MALLCIPLISVRIWNPLYFRELSFLILGTGVEEFLECYEIFLVGSAMAATMLRVFAAVLITLSTP